MSSTSRDTISVPAASASGDASAAWISSRSVASDARALATSAASRCVRPAPRRSSRPPSAASRLPRPAVVAGAVGARRAQGHVLVGAHGRLGACGAGAARSVPVRVPRRAGPGAVRAGRVPRRVRGLGGRGLVAWRAVTRAAVLARWAGRGGRGSAAAASFLGVAPPSAERAAAMMRAGSAPMPSTPRLPGVRISKSRSARPVTPKASRAARMASSTVRPVNSWYSLIGVSLAGCCAWPA